jgi:hypothetical protein
MLSVISLGLFIAAAYVLSIFIRRNEVTLRRRAEATLSDHSPGRPASGDGVSRTSGHV